MSAKKLYKSNEKKIFGVCGGIAEYFNLDPTIIRIIALTCVFFGFGCPILVYIIAAFCMPDAPAPKADDKKDDENMKSANL